MDDKLYNDILMLLKKGMSVRDIAIELEIPERIVYKIAKKSGNNNDPEGGKII